jgi:hypothetical protein
MFLTGAGFMRWSIQRDGIWGSRLVHNFFIDSLKSRRRSRPAIVAGLREFTHGFYRSDTKIAIYQNFV